MSYKLTTPCPQCPFRTDIAPYLQPERVREIEHNLHRGEFYCHKTTNSDRFNGEEEGNGSYYNPSGHEEHCAGALILLEKLERPSQMMRIAERLGLYDRRNLNMDAPVFDTFDAMEQVAAGEKAVTR